MIFQKNQPILNIYLTFIYIRLQFKHSKPINFFMNKLLTSLLITCGFTLLTGCASISKGTTQTIRVDTKASDGSVIDQADCQLTNNKGTYSIKSGGSTMIRRSSQNLDISCTNSNSETAQAKVISRANAGLAGNIIFGGVVGAVIDHSNGSAYTYPSWVELVFGESLTFDRRSETNGKPTPATPSETPVSQ